VKQRIVIVGANFAGLAAAQHLGSEFAVTVIDGSRWFEWLPNIHELLSGLKRPQDLRLDRRRLVARAGHRFVQATVASIDADAGRIVTTGGRRIDFDACIVAVGGVGDTHGVRGADRHALQFKGVDDCHAIGRRLAALARRSTGFSVVIVGGGLEGVEAVGEILRRYRTQPGMKLTLVEAGRRLLPGTPARLDRVVRGHCEEYGVRCRLGARVAAVTPKQVRLASGERLRSDLTIWTGGVVAPELLRESSLAPAKGGWAPVTRSLQSTRHDSVFVIGDAAELPQQLSKQAYFALQMGKCAADNVTRYLAGQRLLEFRPSPKPMLVAFGDVDTFLVSGNTVIATPALAAAKEAVYQVTMAQLDPPRSAGGLRTAASRLGRAARVARGSSVLQRSLLPR